ncbi:hypothetical protein ACSFBI_09580 [Variovorax sp. RB3P1]|uniref:hypothetical protein n=1 Tax=Variovorax sp. RB3P1 TaxID=3443732 RepID=UPI003F46D1B5
MIAPLPLSRGLCSYESAIFCIVLDLSFVVAIAEISFPYRVDGVSIYLGSSFLRRAFLVPALLNILYNNWFDKNPFVFWTESKFNFGLLSNPCDLRYLNAIGTECFSSSDLCANTGWIGAGYASAEVVGIIFCSIGIGCLLSFLSAYAKKPDGRFVVAAFAPIIFVIFQSSNLLTSLFTPGLCAALVILMLISSSGGEKTQINGRVATS